MSHLPSDYEIEMKRIQERQAVALEKIAELLEVHLERYDNNETIALALQTLSEGADVEKKGKGFLLEPKVSHR